MKRFLFYILFIQSLALLNISCSDVDDLKSNSENKNTITLFLKANSINTRATESGVDAFNENSIKFIDCFLYKSGSNDDTEAIATFSDVSVSNNSSASLNLTNEQINDLFPSSENTCKIYIIANNSDHTYSKTSINELKKKVITIDLTKKVHDSFVMDGSSSVTKDKDKLTGKVLLDRAASKINFKISSISNFVDSNGYTWTPNLNSMYVSLTKCVNKGYIDNTVVNGGYSVQEVDYYNYPSSNEYKMKQVGTGDEIYYEITTPFYSYSSIWNTKNDSNEPFLKLIIPWTKDGGNSYTNFYYIMPVTETGSLIRNYLYNVKASISILGSPVEEEPVTLNCNCYVTDWGKAGVDAEIYDSRYLVVDKNSYVLNNVNSIDIPYSTSHPTSIEHTSTTQDVTSEIATTKNVTDVKCTIKKIDGKDFIHYEYPLNNDRSSKNYDYTPIYTTITIYHTDRKTIKEIINIVQYPLMYVIADRNSDYKGLNQSNNLHKGYVYVNGGYNDYGSVMGMNGSAKNANPNMYVISISALDQASDDYIIGDPRQSSINNLNTNWVTAPTLYSQTKRTLLYYYPTESSIRTRQIVAPKFRIASSYGITNNILYETAKKRCASYQEDGIPAGRWRMPTKSELEYIVKLSAQNKIPTLFNPDGYYWTINGRCQPSGSDVNVSYNYNNTTSAFVRCVYDEWYWGDERINDKTVFTWGDKQR